MDAGFLGQFLMIGLSGPRLEGKEKLLWQRLQPGGVFLEARNLESPRQVRELTDTLRTLGRFEPVIALAADGEPPSPWLPLGLTFPSPARLAAADDQSAILRCGDGVGRALRLLGIPLALGPRLDFPDPRGPVPHPSSCWGTNADDVVRRAEAFAAALRDTGVHPCARFFPTYGGHPSPVTGPLPVLPGSLDEILAGPARPFLTLLPAFRAIQTGHLLLPEVPDTCDLPASLSAAVVTGFLRHQLGFNGLVLTDAISCESLRAIGDEAETCGLAVLAGNDLVRTRTPLERLPDLLASLGRLPHAVLDDALRRLERFRRKMPRPLAFDEAAWRQVVAETAVLKASIPGMDERESPATVS